MPKIAGHLYFTKCGRAGSYDDVTNDIRINKLSIWWKLVPKSILRHELRHLIWFRFLHPEAKGKFSIRAELFAGV